jgi:hypothetical protein
VAPVADRPTASSFTDVVSPELALVDPALRAAAREQLDDPDDTLARLLEVARAPVRPAPVTAASAAESPFSEEMAEAAARRLAETALAAESAEPVESRALPLPRRLSRLTVVVTAASAGFAIALFVADRALEHEQGQLTSVVSMTEPVTRPVAPPAPSTPAVSNPALSPQRFAWAPVTGAGGYHVELHRDGSRVFAADTTRPAVTIPPSWTYAGRRYRLEAVEYRWYVWPIVSGRRTPKAVVQARLVVRNR